MDDSQKAWETVRPDAPRPEENAGTGSATGVFGAVAAGNSAAAGPEVAAKSAPPAPIVPPAPPVAEVVHPVVHRVVVGGDASGKASDFDELLNRLRAGGAASAAPVERKAPEPVERKPPEVVSAMETAPAPPPAAAGSSGGFTQLLRTLNVEPAAPAASESMAVAQGPVAEAQPVEMRPIAVQTIDLRSPAPDAGFPVLPRTPVVEKAPELAPEARLPQAEEVRSPVATAGPSPEQGTGGFTALLRAGSCEALDFGRSTAAAVPAAAPVESSPGSFTQMFRALDAKAEEAPAAFVPQAPAPAAAAPSTPGTFTQLFRTLDSGANAAAAPAPAARMEPAPVVPQRSDGGSFTQMIAAQRPQDAPSYRESNAPREPQRAAPSPSAWEPPPAPVESWAGTGNQGFGEARPVEPERRPGAAGGGLTQLLRTLDGPSSVPAPRRDETPVAPPPAAGPGMFTQTYQALDGREPAPAAPPPPMQPAPSAPFASGATGFDRPAQPMAPPQPVASAGPSEFTRILDASRMREMGLRGGGAAMPPEPVAQAPQMATPPMPQMAMPPMPQPMMPPTPQPMMPPMQAPMQPHVQPPAPQYAMPPMPQYAAPPMAAPQMAPPVMQPPQAAPAASGMQKHLPMILIAVIFVLVVVVIALIFVMKH